MNKSPSSFSVILAFLCLTLLGFFFIPKLSFKLNPSRKQPVVNIRFSMSGQSPRIVEMEVTSKLEAMLNRVRGIESLQSYSRQNGGGITIKLSEHVDAEMTRFEMSTIVRQAWQSMPEGVSYPSIEMSGVSDEAGRPFLQYTINAPYSPVEIQEYANDNIRNKIAVLKGVNSVDVYGAGKNIYRLEYDYRNLQSFGIKLDDIRKAINTYLEEESLGLADYIDGKARKLIRIRLRPVNGEKDFEPARIQVVNKDGRIVHLDQLVKCSLEEEESSSFYRINGMNSVFLSVTADEGSNRLTLGKNIEQLLTGIQASLPRGYELHKSYDESEYLNKELNRIYLRSGLTVLTLLLFVFAAYRNLKHSLVILLSLVCNLAIAAIIYYILGIEIHVFSLAGLTISVTLVIDNFIIMSDQIVRRGNKKVFMAILAATLTTIGALSIIFFLDDQLRLNLLDFALVVVLNLVMSLVTALLFVPALIEKLRIEKRTRTSVKSKARRKRMLVRFNRAYGRVILFCQGKQARRCITCLLILAFGIPVFLLPEKLGGEKPFPQEQVEGKDNKWVNAYNKTLGGQFYKEHIKPLTDIALGGTMRLFAQKVKNGSYSSGERSETMLYAAASLPNGSTKEQMDALIKKMEQYIAQYGEIKQFETSIESGQRASIRISFKDEYQRGQFPYMLYSKLISKALELSGGSWSVYGVGDGFNNDVKEQAGSSRIKLLGYNYDELNKLAEQIRDSLLQHRRIKEVTIGSEFSWYKNDYSEFVLDIDRKKLSEANLFPSDLYAALIPVFQRSVSTGTWNATGKSILINLYSKQANELDIWNMEHYPGQSGETDLRLTEFARIEKSQAPPEISKENQQYRLCLQYEYIGSYTQAEKVMNRYIDKFNSSAPLGYKAESESYKPWWESGKTSQYRLLLLIFAIIFFTAAILFNSAKRPLIILSIVPVSYIGVFLTFYLFNINFDQGGFAAFILLTGLSINANIYMLDEYYRILKERPNIAPLNAYLKAWNAKIRPISLTILSTIVGFIPFMAGSLKEAFWFPLAAGTSGGLLVSFLALFFLIPVFISYGKIK
ncbi:MAG: multidrug efflux pump protein [Bacteroidetes bacterium]|nr:multidrug efflux pump protein [Bacteroidota bacterium]